MVDGFLLKICICVILCSALGMERQYHYKVIGVRTSLLVGLGAFLFVTFVFSGLQGDQMRLAAAVVTGVGFLGAGVILQHGNRIIGIDTAATLWCVASIGVLCSGGLLLEAAIGALLIFVSNFVLRAWTHSKSRRRESIYHKCSIKVGCDEKSEMKIRSMIVDKVSKDSITMESFEKSFTNKGSVHLNFVFISKNIKFLDSLITDLSDEEGVTKISWSHEIMKDGITEE